MVSKCNTSRSGLTKNYMEIVNCLQAAAERFALSRRDVWAGVDNAWEQEKLEARKMLLNRADSHTSGAPTKMRDIILYERNKGALGQYTPKRQARKPRKAVESALCDSRGAPWFPVKLI